jgi:membrane protease YdiL (CAAX protease family)
MIKQNNKSHKFSLPMYLLLANGITWSCWIPGLIIGAQNGYIMPNFDTYASLFETGFANSQHLLLGIAFQLGVYGPLIGGLVATWIDRGREGLADLWGRITKWQIGGRWYLTAFVITFLIAALPVGVFILVGGYTTSAYTLSYVLFVFAAQLLTSGFGEEPGWRGFLLPRLKTRYEGDKFVWVLGLIWAFWHYPLMIIQPLSAMTYVSVSQALIMVVVSLAGFTMAIIGITFIYVWLYNQTQSIFLLIVFHALSNVFQNWFTSYLEEPQAASLFVGLMPWVVVVILQKRMGKEKFLGIEQSNKGLVSSN